MTVMNIDETKVAAMNERDPMGWLVHLVRTLEEDLQYHQRVGVAVTQPQLRADHERLVELAPDLLLDGNFELNIRAVERLELLGYMVTYPKGSHLLSIITKAGNFQLPLMGA